MSISSSGTASVAICESLLNTTSYRDLSRFGYFRISARSRSCFDSCSANRDYASDLLRRACSRPDWVSSCLNTTTATLSTSAIDELHKLSSNNSILVLGAGKLGSSVVQALSLHPQSSNKTLISVLLCLASPTSTAKQIQFGRLGCETKNWARWINDWWKFPGSLWGSRAYVHVTYEGARMTVFHNRIDFVDCLDL